MQTLQAPFVGGLDQFVDQSGGGCKANLQALLAGRQSKSQSNVREALRALGVAVRWNEFCDRGEVGGLPGFPDLTDAALVRMRLMIDAEFGFEPPKDWFADVLLEEGRVWY